MSRADSDLHTYRKKLLYLNSDLTSDNIKCLKFLCLDNIPFAKLERIDQGIELFEILMNYNLLGPVNLYFLGQCLNVISRKDLSSYLIDSQVLDIDIRRISLYRILLFHISEDMDEEDLVKCIGKIPKSKRTMITTGMDLFAYLEQVKVISPQNLNYLIELLEKLGRGDLKEKVDEYKNPVSIQPPQPMDCYRMDRKPRGFCVIINNEKFERDPMDANSGDLKNRQGSSIDRDRLIETFGKLSFIVKRYDDLTAVEMACKIKHFALNKDHTNYDCFVVAILSHGTRDNVYGSDGRMVAIRDLTGPLKPHSCPSLCDKPKLFFIQACQGQEGTPIEQVNFDEVIPNEADFLLGMSTMPGLVSYRSKTMGSWYITKLCENFNQHTKHYDILNLLEVVNKEVEQAIAELDGAISKQFPALYTFLRKRLIFQ